jgi:hypothetical protein
MSVNSVLTGLRPYDGPLSGNSSPTAKSAALAKEPSQKTFAETDLSRSTGAEADSAIRDHSVTSNDAPALGQFQGTLDRELREGRTAAGKSTSGTSEWPSSRSSSGVALYQRISQYGNNASSTSALLESWNTIMQGGKESGVAVVAFAKALSGSEALEFKSGVLDLTA